MKRLLLLTVSLLLVAPWAYSGDGKPPKAAGQKVLSVQWAKELKGGGSKKKFFPEMASPHISGNHALVGTHSGNFYSLDVATGRQQWVFDSKGPIASQAASGNGVVYFGNNKGILYALDEESGQLRWERYLGGEVLSQPALSGDRVYVVTTAREIYALNASNGDVIWTEFIKGTEAKSTMRGNSPVVVSGENLYVGFADGQIVCFNKKGGTVWSQNLAQSDASFKDVDATILVDGNSLYVGGYFGSVVRLTNAGRVVWKKKLRVGADMALGLDKILISTDDGRVVALEKGLGDKIWEVPLYSGALSGPIVMNGKVVVGTYNGKTFVFDEESGKALQVLTNGFLSKAVPTDAAFYFLSTGSRLTAMTVAN